MLVGYANDRGASQSLELQLRALSNAGCAKMFSEQKCGTSMGAQDVLQRALDFVRRGDTLVVTQLDRLARSADDIHGILASLARSGVNFRCLQQSQVELDNPQQDQFQPFLAMRRPSPPGPSDESASAIGQT